MSIRTKFAVDLQVRGIDRQPTDLVDEVVAAALAHKDQVPVNQLWDAQSAARIRQEDDSPGDLSVQTPLLDEPLVLLVDDNDSNLEMLSTYPRLKGYKVLAARAA